MALHYDHIVKMHLHYGNGFLSMIILMYITKATPAIRNFTTAGLSKVLSVMNALINESFHTYNNSAADDFENNHAKT